MASLGGRVEESIIGLFLITVFWSAVLPQLVATINTYGTGNTGPALMFLQVGLAGAVIAALVPIVGEFYASR